jgi:hypothetical protein
MALTYLNGGRIQGSDSVAGSITGYKELARASVNSGTSTTLTTPTFTPKDNIMIVYTAWGDGEPRMRVGSSGTLDTQSNYAQRWNENNSNGDNSSPTTSSDRWQVNSGAGPSSDGNEGVFGIMEGVNITGFEKLFYHESVDNCAGTGTASAKIGRYNRAMKWANTSARINVVSLYCASGSFSAGTEIVVLGFDNDESGTSTTDFWKLITTASYDSSNPDILDTGVNNDLKKKYLMIRWFTMPTSGNTDDIYINYNGDANSNYSYSRQGGNSTMENFSATNKPRIDAGNGAYQRDGFGFLINIQGKEKLLTSQDIIQDGGAGSNQKPRDFEVITKWTGSSQINRISLTNQGSGNYKSNSYFEVWGSD